MGRQQGWLTLILALTALATAALASFPLQLGLDLRGGSQLTLRVQPDSETSVVQAEQLEAVRQVLDRRINGLGVEESALQTLGSSQLVLQLAGEADPSKAAEVLGKTALLEFRAEKEDSSSQLQQLTQLRALLGLIQARVGPDNTLTEQDSELIQQAREALQLPIVDNTEEVPEQLKQLQDSVDELISQAYGLTQLTGKNLTRAGIAPEPNRPDVWVVTLDFNKDGGDRFAELTRNIADTGKTLGIFLDGRRISAAVVGPEFKETGISGGAAQISGGFSFEEARELEILLRGGSLPLPVTIIEQRTVGPSLGAENVRRSLVAALTGLALVVVFMILVYRLAGIVAMVALSLYLLFNLATYTLIPVTLTLPGIAGLILSIGMAVDANILVFKRVKDELQQGNTLIRSIEAGFSRAFSSILDGHLTTLISCAALFLLGTGFIKGFAATLGIGVSLSLFTALSCTRTLLRFLMTYPALRRVTYFLPAHELPSASPLNLIN
ncbi:protein translocase subunit SecD [cyanobiont of Ornithocercus magnificus]|nr:protein translocase subunit SecD [cyanobiont of Ornithocercus magnificus]